MKLTDENKKHIESGDVHVKTTETTTTYTRGAVKDCCVTPENLEVTWSKTDQALEKPDLETKTCKVCGCRHRRWVLQAPKIMEMMMPEPERTK